MFKKPLRYEQNFSSGNPPVETIDKLNQLKEASLDTDKDGLKDWEERLWGTDPNNPDTDGDGAQDGEEIRQNRDPLKSGPDDKVIQFQPAAVSEKLNAQSQNNLTEELARQLVVSYFSQKAAGKEPVISGQELVNNVLEGAPGRILQDEFNEEDFSRFSKNSIESKKFFLNQIGEILKNNFQAIQESEIAVLTRSFKNENSEELKKLDEYELAYAKTVSDLKNLSIPDSKDFKNIHLLIINIMNNLRKSVEMMRLSYGDPIKGFIGLNWYINETKRWGEFLREFEVLTAKEGISFESAEGGAYILSLLKFKK